MSRPIRPASTMSDHLENNPPREYAILRATVKGRVHNVGFRMFVYERARALGLGGYVRNAPDNAVEVYAVGPHPEVDQLLQALWSGPSAARVTRVEHTLQAAGASEIPTRFEVRP